MLKEKVITNNSTGTPLTTSPNSTASSFPVTPKNVKPASKIPSPFEQSLQSQPARVSTTSVPIDPITRITIRKPILSVDVNLGEGVNEKLIVYQGENANEVSRRLVEKYNIDETLRSKFEMMLHTHIRSLLWKIDEVAEEMITDREE